MPRSLQSAASSIDRLYAEHHGWLRGWLRRRLDNHGDAADLAQDTFVRVLRARSSGEIREPRQYLVTIARGLVVDLFRRRAIERQYLDLLAALPEPQAPSPETRALVIETLMELDAMLSGLGPRVRQTFLLSQCDGLTYPEIAEKLGISLRSVNNYMARAMEHCCLFRLRQA